MDDWKKIGDRFEEVLARTPKKVKTQEEIHKEMEECFKQGAGRWDEYGNWIEIGFSNKYR